MRSGESAGPSLETSLLSAVEMVKSACGRKVLERVGSVLVISLVRRVTGRLQRTGNACVLRAVLCYLLLVYMYSTTFIGSPLPYDHK